MVGSVGTAAAAPSPSLMRMMTTAPTMAAGDTYNIHIAVNGAVLNDPIALADAVESAFRKKGRVTGSTPAVRR